MRWLFVSFILLSRCAAELNIPDLLRNESNVGAPGTRARISRKGVHYVAATLMQTLLSEIVNSRLPDAQHMVKNTDENLALTEISLIGNSAPGDIESEIAPPNLILINVPNLNMTIRSVLNHSDGNLWVDLMAENVVVQLDIEATKTSVGAPNIRVHDCNVDVAVAPRVVFAENVTEAMKSQLRSPLERAALEMLGDLLCTRVHFIVEERVNERFGLLSPKIPLAHINDDEVVRDLATKLRARRQRRLRRDSHRGVGIDLAFDDDQFTGSPRLSRAKRQWAPRLGAGIGLPMGMRLGAGLGRKRRDINVIAGINVSRADSLALDYTITSDMKVTQFGLEIESSGEVSLRGRGGTPFGPVFVPLPQSVNEDYMLQMIVSDFMPNSLMYHGHTIGIFNTRIDPTTPHFGAIMRTSCSLSTGMLFCLGDLFPTLRRIHPNRRLALFFNTVQAPVIRFRTQSSGGISFSLLGRIVIIVIDPESRQETQVAEMGIEVLAQMKMRLSAAMVRPRISLERIKLTTLSPGILLQNELDDAVVLAREVLQRMVNDILKDGIPIPVHPLFKLVKPKVKVLERGLLLQTNFELNERLLHQLTAPDLRKRL